MSKVHDDIQIKRNYLKQLEEVESKLNDLYDFNEVNCIRLVDDDYKFTKRLDLFLEDLVSEIESQEKKLNRLEDIILKEVHSSKD